MLHKSYQLSPNVRIISDSESGAAMVYHSLYGNPRVLNADGLQFLELFRRPISVEEIRGICDADPESVIQQLADIYFLVTPGFQERNHLHEQQSRHLEKVRAQKTVDRMGLAISDSCNLGCAHCIHFQPSSSTGRSLPIYQRTAKELIMSWETAQTCIDQYISLMRRHGKTLCKIHFGNAEPLINWNVMEKVLHYCSSMSDLSFEFAVNTNLLLLTREIAEALKHYRVRIATSLDGTADANDMIRTTRTGKGTFSDILHKFDLLDEIGYQLDGFSITVTGRNFEIIDTDILDLAAEKGMTSIAFDYDLTSLTSVTVQDRVNRLMHFKKYANARGIDFFGTWDSAFRNLTSESLLTGNHAFCAAVEGKSLEFNIDGSIKVCSHSTTQVGHVHDFDRTFADNGGLFRMVQSRFPGMDSLCFGCEIEGSCGGQCHVTREAAACSAKNGYISLFDDMCNFYRMVTQQLAVEYIRTHATSW